MPNNPSGGGGATSPASYYPNANLFGQYQFISLTEVVNNFVATYVGEGKILSNTLKGDVNYHAHRALQELSYDTLKSCKSQEIEVCPNLRMPLPHDYVNYVKLTWHDSNGIEHVIYPAHKTSNPFAISQDENCEYRYERNGEGGAGGLLEQENCVTTTTTCSLFEKADWDSALNNAPSFPSILWPYDFTIGSTLHSYDNECDMYDGYTNAVDVYCNCLAPNNLSGAINCGARRINGWEGCGPICNDKNAKISATPCTGWSGWPMSETGAVTYTTTVCDGDSDTLNAWESSGSSSTNISSSNTTATDDDTYNNNLGQRYGIDPQFAQNNGSFYIECRTGMIYFDSNMAGRTVTLKYISDGHGTDDEMIVHKFAEEAMYKWIAYGCASARIDVPENIIQRLKKERFAETRKAKIRLSNIKIEEISQVFRGKSKWIKH